MNWLQRLWNEIRGWFSPRPTRFGVLRVEEIPDKPSAGTAYLVGEGQHLWFVALLCPCGCKEFLQMSLLQDSRPRWTVMIHEDGTPTLHPSIWRKTGCRSHFFLRRGRVEWC